MKAKRLRRLPLSDNLRKVYCDCLSTVCRDEGVYVELDRIATNRVLISGNKYKELRHYSDELCDFILFEFDYNPCTKLALIEMKGGSLDQDDAKKAHGQLQNGAYIAGRMSAAEPRVIFRPFLVKRRNKRINKFAGQILNMPKYWVNFGSISRQIKVVNSGESIELPDG